MHRSTKAEFSSLWQDFQVLHQKKRLAHALLLSGPETAKLLELSYAIAAAILCKQATGPCHRCKSCHLMSLSQHPDLSRIEPDKTGGLIKVDQIRDLQELAFRSPQLGTCRMMILYPADRMNLAASNALLKLLEEPPLGVFFVLVAEQSGGLAATILSRCQQWQFSPDLDGDYLSLASKLLSPLAATEKKSPLEDLSLIIEGLSQLLSSKISICTLAEKWSIYEFSQLVKLLYFIQCQLIAYQFKSHEGSNRELYQLAQHFQPMSLFQQLDELNKITKNLQQNINVNQLLVLENLLLGYFAY